MTSYWVYLLLLVPWFAIGSQILRLVKTRRARDISVSSLLFWIGYHSAWTCYNISVFDPATPAYLLNSSSQLLMTVVLLVATVYYKTVRP